MARRQRCSRRQGFRGEPRSKPPFPTTHGLFQEPTAISNPETLLNVLDIVQIGADGYRSRHRAVTRHQAAVPRPGREPGVYEVEFGTTLGEVLELAGGSPAGHAQRRADGRRGWLLRRPVLPRHADHSRRRPRTRDHPRLGCRHGVHRRDRPGRCARPHLAVLPRRVVRPVCSLPGRLCSSERDDGRLQEKGSLTPTRANSSTTSPR